MNPNPFLQYRHALGLGDLVACTLHSKYLNPVTTFITGKDGMCMACDSRRQALNMLFPIPIWKLFYNSKEEQEKSIQKYIVYEDVPEEKAPEEIINHHKQNEIQKPIIKEFIQEPTIEKIKNVPNNEEIEDYRFLNSSDVHLDNYIIRTTIYRKI
jgi:hypothetical protein